MAKYQILYAINAMLAKVRVLSVMVLFLLAPLVAGAADVYVTFDDERLLVFPDSCVQSMVQDDGYLTLTALDGTVFSYSLENIVSIDGQLTKQLPEITSYKFNNKLIIKSLSTRRVRSLAIQSMSRSSV